MSDIIHLLPDSVANQIAAGEVIQRPASVIKELVENAIDAGARNVRVIVADAGRTSIQVIDDGCGMSETDARLAFERHATSKILKADDLFALNTMGFRGEALPSIAAVAQVTLSTRMATDEIGTTIVLHASKVISQEPAACPVGSNFKVDNLFFNVPARRKFLKSNTTELNNILTAFERIVLVYPDVAFTFFSNQQEMLNLRAGSLKQRISDVFGKKVSQELLPMEINTGLCRIKGFVGKPEAARKKGAHNFFFVNGRYMRHPYFHKAVVNAYDRMLPEGMQPAYFIYFEVAPASIDVNIHPTKTEIKFEYEQDIFQLLSASVRDALGRFCDIPSIDFDTEGRPDIPVFDPLRDAIQMPGVKYNPSYNPFDGHSPRDSSPSHSFGAVANLFPSAPSPTPAGSSSSMPLFPDDETPPAAAIEKSPEHYQYKGRFIMTAVKSGLMIIDQHRAAIRIRYERYMLRLKNRQSETQRLLFPAMLQLPPSDAQILANYMPDLTAMGFDVADLGGGSFAINGVPADSGDADPSMLLRNIISEAAELGVTEGSNGDVTASLALKLAHNTAVDYGQVLSNEEMERLVNELFACSNPNFTPDGKPVIAIMPQTDIERLLA